MVTEDDVELYRSIPQEAGLKAPEKSLNNCLIKFQQKIWLKLLNLFLRTTIWNLTVKLNSRFREQQ